LNPKYPIAEFYVTKLVVNVVNGELMDESRTCLLASICILNLFLEIISNGTKKKSISEPMPHFRNDTFSKYYEKV